MLRHFQMQHIAGIWIGVRHFFIQFDAQARRIWRDNMPLFEADWRL